MMWIIIVSNHLNQLIII